MEELATVIFSPQHAKAVSQVLAHAVQSWEKIHGEIALSASQIPANITTPTLKAPAKTAKPKATTLS